MTSISHNLLNNLPGKTGLVLSTAVAGSVFLFLPFAQLEFRLLAAWSSGVLCFLILLLLTIGGADAEKTRYRTRRQEASHSAIFLLVVFTAFTSLLVIGVVLAKNKDTFTPQVTLSAGAILCSWLLMQTMFALHYATFYYRQDRWSQKEKAGGLVFSSGELPTYWDFLYFAFTLGMTSQTSDTTITSSSMRRLVLAHGIVSFFFYSVIIAMTVSIVSGLL